MKRYKLGEIADVIMGQSPESKYYNTEGKGLPFLQGNRTFGERYPDFDTYTSVTTKKAKAHDVLMSVRAPVGAVNITPIDVCLGRGLCALRMQNGNQDYLYYLMKYYSSQFNKSYGGTIFPSINRDEIKSLIVNIVDDKYLQQRIAKILSTIDAKIELNKKINRELETMAKELYDYWFVQFDFPNEQGKPYKSSGGKMVWNETLKREIPEGWEVKKLGDIISKLSSGKRPKGGIDKTLKTGIPSLGAECINEHLGEFDFLSTPFIKDSFKDKLSNGKIEKNDILIYKDGAYVGKVTLFRDGFPYQDAYVNEHVFLIHATEEKYEEFLYFTLSSSSYFKIMQNLGKVKAAQPGLNKDDLNSIMLLVPGKDIIINFHNKVESYFRKIFLNANQLGRLIVLRNQLLPLLMNGQVRVSEKKVSSVSQKDNTNRFVLWKNTYPVAARGEKNDTVLRAMYEAMDDEDK